MLGLGDTNYDKFCHMGKSIDKRLMELGGNRVLPLACADEATGLEETVESWKSKFFELARKIHQKLQLQLVNEESVCDTVCNNLVELKLQDDKSVRCSDTNSCSPALVEDPLLKQLSEIPRHIMEVTEVAQSLNILNQYRDAISNESTATVKNINENVVVRFLGVQYDPSLHKSAPIFTPPPPAPISSPSSTNLAGSVASEWTVDRPFNAKIIKAKWLTTPSLSQSAFNEGKEDISQWGSHKRVVYCEVSLKDSNISYLPGDSIGICCPNPPYAVDIVFRRLQQSSPDGANLMLDSAVELKTVGAEHSETHSIVEILRFRLDLTSIPKKTVVSFLATVCTNPVEKQQLLYIAGKDKVQRSLWNSFIEAQGLGVAELLALFPSCSPTLAQLCSVCQKPVPRFYSIATSPLSKPDTVAIAFSLVRNQFSVSVNAEEVEKSDGRNKKKIICRAGVCTSYLEYLLRLWLYPATAPNTVSSSSSSPSSSSSALPSYATHAHPIVAEEQLRIFHKPNPTFRLPGSVSYPLVLIGPGTGVVPFMSFLEHRFQAELERIRHKEDKTMSSGVWRGGFDLDECDLPCESNKVGSYIHSVKPNEIWLFYGCRTHDDYLFPKELAFYQEQHILTHFEIAMSRLGLLQQYRKGQSPEGTSLTESEKVASPSAVSSKYYVTDKLLEQGKRIYELIMNENGYVYICGDGNAMAKDVQRVLKEIIQQYSPSSPCSEEEANKVITELRTRRRLLLDIWC